MNNLLVFDLGFNHGNFSNQVLSIFPESRIVGVEGHPMYFVPQLPNITLIHAVISDKLGVDIPFYICDSNPGINSINPEWIKAIRHKHFFDKTQRTVMVPSITIDSLISQYGIPNIIKMDIEGSESIALNGLSQKCGLILFEWSEEFFYDAEKCINRLKTLGYNQFAYTEQNDTFNLNLSYKNWEDLEIRNNIVPERKERWGMIYAL